MQTIQIANFNENVYNIIDDTIINSKITEVESKCGTVVLMDKKKWLELRETLLLLKDEKSLKALLEGHVNRESGNAIGIPFEEFFDDI